MNKRALLFICTVFAASFTANAEEMSGVCNLHPNDLLASFGFASSGTNLHANQLIPAGTFAQVGTATGTTATQKGTTISGRWTVTITQNDSSGAITTFTLPGDYTVDTNTCAGDFSWDGIGKVFRAVFVDHAKEFKSTSVLPGVIISYSGRKL